MGERQFVIFQEKARLGKDNQILSYTHTYHGPYGELEVEPTYQKMLKARSPHEIILKIELGVEQPMHYLE